MGVLRLGVELRLDRAVLGLSPERAATVASENNDPVGAPFSPFLPLLCFEIRVSLLCCNAFSMRR